MESDATTGDIEENIGPVGPVDPPTILRWKLHEKIAVKSGAGGTIKVIMSIEVWKGISLDPGVIGLHFLELYQDSYKSYQDGMCLCFPLDKYMHAYELNGVA
jgi:hypothetical protein